MLAWSLINLGRIEEASDLVDRMYAEHPEDQGGQFASLQAILFAWKAMQFAPNQLSSKQTRRAWLRVIFISRPITSPPHTPS
jgi:hypothetical protein